MRGVSSIATSPSSAAVFLAKSSISFMLKTMKTIFIPAFQGVSGRMMFRTSIFEHLFKIPDARFVIFVPTEGKKEYYEKELASPPFAPLRGATEGKSRVNFEVLPLFRPNRLDRAMSALKFYLLNSGTTRVRRRMKLEETKNIAAYLWGRLLDVCLAHAP